VTSHVSKDGSVKHVLQLDDDATIEVVLIPEENRSTVCVSSQTGCALGCRFCSTAALGPGRDLSSAEIIGQLRVALRDAREIHTRVNVVFMGMGEPLLNRQGVGRALEAIAETISLRRVTVSTAGVVPGVRWLATWPRRPKLAVSLNAPDQERRAQLMPIARRYPLHELLAALRELPLEHGRRITFEYVVIEGFNDAPADAQAVSQLLEGIPAKVNVIPLNPDPIHLPGLAPPAEPVLETFVRSLGRRSGLTVTVRRSRGQDVAGACGQLTGAVRTASDHCRPAATPSRR
jgi:23S rRNA (adenine2503-C2)-methyltransferase